MTFVIEKVSEQDIEKFGLREINERFWKGNGDYHWVIDRERDVYLRYLCHGDRDTPYRNDFSFYWKGTLLTIRLEKRGEGVRGGKGSTTWSWGGWQLPESLASHREEIIANIKEALIAYKDNGMYSTIADHTACFTF
jgi:hypothetical protein